MTFENITRILLPKEAPKETQKTVVQPINSSVANYDDLRARRNRLAALTAHSKPLKKAA